MFFFLLVYLYRKQFAGNMYLNLIDLDLTHRCAQNLCLCTRGDFLNVCGIKAKKAWQHSLSWRKKKCCRFVLKNLIINICIETKVLEPDQNQNQNPSEINVYWPKTKENVNYNGFHIERKEFSPVFIMSNLGRF